MDAIATSELEALSNFTYQLKKIFKLLFRIFGVRRRSKKFGFLVVLPVLFSDVLSLP
jgi:hypothetical protein